MQLTALGKSFAKQGCSLVVPSGIKVNNWHDDCPEGSQLSGFILV